MSEEVLVDNTEITDENPKTEETQELKQKKNKYVNDNERHSAILKSKREYYHRNNDIFKLKSRRRYYNNKLAKENISDELKDKYTAKLTEIEQQINNFNKSEEK